jgi:hypothetical protein
MGEIAKTNPEIRKKEVFISRLNKIDPEANHI